MQACPGCLDFKESPGHRALEETQDCPASLCLAFKEKMVCEVGMVSLVCPDSVVCQAMLACLVFQVDLVPLAIVVSAEEWVNQDFQDCRGYQANRETHSIQSDLHFLAQEATQDLPDPWGLKDSQDLESGPSPMGP